MGTASTVGSVGSVLAFGAGLYVGVNLDMPWPLAWSAGITLGVLLAGTVSVAAEYVDHRKRYGLNWFGTHITRDVAKDVEVEDCFACSGADRSGVRVEWSKDDVFFGLVTNRHAGGYSYYCEPCHTDAIEAGLRTGKEHEFRQRFENGENDGLDYLRDEHDHYTEALAELREDYLDRDDSPFVPDDFWEFVEGLSEEPEVEEPEPSDEVEVPELDGLPDEYY